MTKVSLSLVALCIVGCASQSTNVDELAAASRKAGQAYAQGNCDRAIPHYMRLVNELPQDLDSRIKIANCIYLQGDSVGAIRQYKGILRSDPTYSSAWYNLGYVQLEELMESLKDVIDSITSESEENKIILHKTTNLLNVYRESDEELGLVN